ncbi:MAG TPA: polysaccharide biosynthesis protein, partial [Solirubrobacteraceae bacterium]|nr:polysaccharide biosynthesis protein [Solirubrobacteraceae bacterium]
YKHVDWAERYPEEFAATNLDGSWNVLRAARDADTVVVASPDKAARASSMYGRTKRMMETLTALAAERAGGGRAAVRLVNVLGSAGSATELWLRQARAGVPLALTDPAMVRFWITMAHAASLVATGRWPPRAVRGCSPRPTRSRSRSASSPSGSGASRDRPARRTCTSPASGPARR